MSNITKPKKSKNDLNYTLKDNRLFIPGVGVVEKPDFNKEHFDKLLAADKDAVKKYLVVIPDKNQDEDEGGEE